MVDSAIYLPKSKRLERAIEKVRKYWTGEKDDFSGSNIFSGWIRLIKSPVIMLQYSNDKFQQGKDKQLFITNSKAYNVQHKVALDSFRDSLPKAFTCRIVNNNFAKHVLLRRNNWYRNLFNGANLEAIFKCFFNFTC